MPHPLSLLYCLIVINTKILSVYNTWFLHIHLYIITISIKSEMKARNKIIVTFLCILAIIILVTLAFYAEQFEVWNSFAPVYSNVFNKLIAEFKALFNISNTFGNDLLKSSISLFIVINPIGSITLLFR